MAAKIQQAIIDVLIKKALKAANDYNVETIIVGGGVSANQELRKQFSALRKKVIFPKKEFSTDNAVMTAVAGYYNKEKATKNYDKIKSMPNLRV